MLKLRQNWLLLVAHHCNMTKLRQNWWLLLTHQCKMLKLWQNWWLLDTHQCNMLPNVIWQNWLLLVAQQCNMIKLRQIWGLLVTHQNYIITHQCNTLNMWSLSFMLHGFSQFLQLHLVHGIVIAIGDLINIMSDDRGDKTNIQFLIKYNVETVWYRIFFCFPSPVYNFCVFSR